MGERVIAEVRSEDGWPGFVEAFRLAFADLGISYQTAGELAGLPSRYVGKLLSPIQVRSIGKTSFGPLLGAAAVKIVFVRDEEMLARIVSHHKFIRRHAEQARYASAAVRTGRKRKRRVKLAPDMARLMRSRGLLLSTPTQRKRWARMAAQARWRKAKRMAKANEFNQEEESKCRK